MSTFEDIYCSNCKCKTEQALMLSCEHNLCMNCAAKNLNSKTQQLKQYIICDLCGSKTEIDNQTSQEIFSSVFKNLNLDPNLLNTNRCNKHNNNGGINSNNNNLYKTENLNQTCNPNYTNKEVFVNSMDNLNNNLLISNSNIINRKNICNEHGELISYLCLDCMNNCICSECIVHGAHRNHDVLNIKKAYPLIYSKVQDLYKNIYEKIKEFESSKRNIEQKKRSIESLNIKCKDEIKNAFNMIRIRLNEKEKEIISKTESTLKDNINELNTYGHVLESKLAVLNKTIESLNANMMRKDELNLINYYCDNKNKIESQIELNENRNVFNMNTIADLRINIDKNSFNNMLIALNNLDFEINSFKPIDISNQFNSGKYIAQRNLYGINSDKKNEFNLDLPLYNKKKKNCFYNYENKKINTEMPLKISKNKIDKKRTKSAKGKRYK